METPKVSSEKPKDQVKKELPPNLQKICLVCGDKALSYNFNVISCESCKAFFRRNALTTKEFKCPFSNNCEITVVTRRFCQKCRLEKCLSVGMVKEFIMSDQDKAEKRKKIEENRAKKRKSNDVEEPVSSTKRRIEDAPYTPKCDSGIIQYDNLTSTTMCSPSSTVLSETSNSGLDNVNSPPTYNAYVPVQNIDFNTYTHYPEETRYIEGYTINQKLHYDQNTVDSYTTDCNIYEQKQNTIKSILLNEASMSFTDTKVQQHVCDNDTPSTSNNHTNDDASVDKAREILQDVERIEPNSMESILCEAIKLEFEAYTSIGSCNRSSRELNEVEQAKLNELIVANKALHAPIDEDVTQFVAENDGVGIKDATDKHHPELILLVNLTAIAIRRLIKMAKKINAFKNMCEEDQVALLKGGCLEVMVMRSTMNYDGQMKSWNIPKIGHYESIKTDVLKFAKNRCYQAYEAFIGSFDPKWRNDEQLILIVKAILLFAPDRPKVVHRDVIKLEQNSYYYLLRRYLESIYPGCEAKSTFLKLIQKIGELRKLCQIVTDVYLDVNPIEPLLIEIFDLKKHQMI